MKSRVLLTALFVVLLTGLVCYANDVMINGDFEVVDPNNADRPLAWSPQAFSTNSSFAYVYDPAAPSAVAAMLPSPYPPRDDRGQWGKSFGISPPGTTSFLCTTGSMNHWLPWVMLLGPVSDPSLD